MLLCDRILSRETAHTTVTVPVVATSITSATSYLALLLEPSSSCMGPVWQHLQPQAGFADLLVSDIQWRLRPISWPIPGTGHGLSIYELAMIKAACVIWGVPFLL